MTATISSNEPELVEELGVPVSGAHHVGSVMDEPEPIVVCPKKSSPAELQLIWPQVGDGDPVLVIDGNVVMKVQSVELDWDEKGQLVIFRMTCFGRPHRFSTPVPEEEGEEEDEDVDDGAELVSTSC